MYSLIKPLLFKLDPEISHTITLKTFKLLNSMGLIKEFIKPISKPCEIMGLTFLNPVGLAAGLDKNGDYIDALAALGFGFIEIGTVTRKPQRGNPKPRLFRLVADKAIINRMGFNNKGVDYLIEQIKKSKYKGVLGINIGKNKETPNEEAVEEYLYLYRRVAPYASYVTVNLSSPNTQNLRDLQHGESLSALLKSLKKEQAIFLELNNKYVPIVVKIAPDLSIEQINAMSDIFLEEKIDAVIATNTTLDRDKVSDSQLAKENGGLSGQPLFTKSTQIVYQLHQKLKDKIPIIAVGGVMTADDALEKIKAGASLIQLYTGLIYQGPRLIEDCIRVC